MSEAHRPWRDLEDALGHRFHCAARIELALCHPSYAHERDGSRGNERLEFLGDAALDLVVADLLYAAHPDWNEGQLTRARAALVNTRSLADCSRALQLGEHLLLGRTELKGGGANKDSILANLFEAVVGALYLDGGLAPIERLTRRLFAAAFATDAAPTPGDPKTRFQEWSHAQFGETPHYETVRDRGVENAADRFEVAVRVGETLYGWGRGRSKRAASCAAAQNALESCATE